MIWLTLILSFLLLFFSLNLVWSFSQKIVLMKSIGIFFSLHQISIYSFYYIIFSLRAFGSFLFTFVTEWCTAQKNEVFHYEVNVTKSTFTEEILNRKLHFLRSYVTFLNAVNECNLKSFVIQSKYFLCLSMSIVFLQFLYNNICIIQSTQSVFTCSKSRMETPGPCLKIVQS